MRISFSEPDKFGIVGKKEHNFPLPVGYIYCPHCSECTKLRGINHSKEVWYGKCQCKIRITYRPKDMAIAWVDLSGLLHSIGFEARTFTTSP